MALASRPCTLRPAAVSRRSSVCVEANKRVQKKQQVILVKEVAGVGAEGDLLSVPLGFWRNYLAPNRMARPATDGILESIQKEKQKVVNAKLQEKAQAQGFANALSTIGKFMLKAKAGEKDALFGSISKQDVSDAVYQQTGRSLTEFEMELPDIKTLGTYEVQVKLHPEVVGTFSVVIQREKVAQAKKK